MRFCEIANKQSQNILLKAISTRQAGKIIIVGFGISNDTSLCSKLSWKAKEKWRERERERKQETALTQISAHQDLTFMIEINAKHAYFSCLVEIKW